MALNLYDEKKDGPFEDLGYRTKIAGINHMAWLLELTKDGKDVYPQMRKLGPKIVSKYRGGKEKHGNLIRLEMMNRFGYYVTESATQRRIRPLLDQGGLSRTHRRILHPAG